MVTSLGRDLHAARLEHGLSQEAVGRATGLSDSEVGRIERGLIPSVSVTHCSRLLSVVGLELSARAFPAGSPIRGPSPAATAGTPQSRDPCPSRVATGGLDRANGRSPSVGRRPPDRFRADRSRSRDAARRCSGRPAPDCPEVSGQRDPDAILLLSAHPHKSPDAEVVRSYDPGFVSDPRTRIARGAPGRPTSRRQFSHPALRSAESRWARATCTG